jgi:hypothetical protein
MNSATAEMSLRDPGTAMIFRRRRGLDGKSFV